MMGSERRVAAGLLSLGMLVGAGLWLGLRAAAHEWRGAPPQASRPAVAAATAEAASGFVVWESKRSGKWRLWRSNLDGSAIRQLSRDEGERIHCCAHIAPDGKTIAWLSLDPGPDRYPRSGPQLGSLRLMSADGSGERELAARARTYGEHRAAVWRDRSRLIWIDGSGRTIERDLVAGSDSVLVEAPSEAAGWLIDATLRTANQNLPSFSRYDTGRKAVVEMQALGGCQPWVSADGLWGVWTAGAGGPLDAFEISSRRTHQLVAKNDPRLPEPQGYLYFPMLSTDRRYLAFAASNGGHDHWKADYDVHLARLDPNAMEVVGKIVRLASHPAPDRFPDVFATPGSPLPGSLPPSTAPARTPAAAAPSRDANDRLLFQWMNAKAANEVVDAALGERRSFPIVAREGARFDRRLRMQVGPGTFEASPEAGAAIVAGAQAANEMAMDARITPTRSPQSGSVLALGGGQVTNFALAQKGDRLSLRLGLSLRGWVEREFDLGPIAAGRETHVAWSYRPGRLVAWRDGQVVLDTTDAQGDFFRWRARPLTFGGGWSGTIESIRIFGRTLTSEEIPGLSRAAGPDSSTMARSVRATLLAKSPTPTLDEISPYREALAVYEYQALDGARERLRVAHWVRLDGEVLPVTSRRIGETYELRLEPFAEQPQLESVYLGDELSKSSAPLLFDVSAGGK